MADSFIFYKSFQEAIKCLESDDRLQVYEAIADYGLYGEYKEPTSGVAKAILMMAIPQMDANAKRRDAGKSGGRPKKKPMVSEDEESEKPMVLKSEEKKKPMVLENEKSEKPMVITKTKNEKPNVNVNANVNVNVNDNVKDNEKGVKGEKRTRFVPPSLSEVTTYCLERANKVDAQAFIDFYESKGWKVGSTPMKDWRAAVRTWERRDKEKGKPKGNQFHNFEQRDYDYDSLEKMLYQGGMTS